MRDRLQQVWKFVGLALAVVFLGPGVNLSPSKDGKG
jgi:hypothetical protein